MHTPRLNTIVLLAVASTAAVSACVNLSPPWGSPSDAARDNGIVAANAVDANPVGAPDVVPPVGADSLGSPPETTEWSSGGIDSGSGVDAPVLGGASGSGGANGVGGMIGSGGISGTGGVIGSGGGIAFGGVNGAGGVFGSGGVIGTGGNVGAGGVADANTAGGTGGVIGTGGEMGTGGVIGTGGITASGGAGGLASGGATSVAVIRLGGSTFGSGPAVGNNPTATYDKAFDGDITTFVDDLAASGGYTGIDLGEGVSSTVVAIRFYPRENWNDRTVLGRFQCSGTSRTDGYVDLYTITAVPTLGWTEVSVSHAPSCRYLRYLGPPDGFDNIAEIEFWGTGTVDGGSEMGSVDAGAPLVNLAINKPVMASSQQTQAGKGAVMGNDGVLSTTFCPMSAAMPVWYVVDLGAVYPLVQTDISVEMPAQTYQYQIEVSTDGASWETQVVQIGSTPYGRGTLADRLDVQARFVRLTITSVSGGYWACFREFSVWGYGRPAADAGVPLTNLSLSKPVKASSEDAIRVAAKGNDGLLATGFCPNGGTFPDWWRVDLGAVYHVAQTDVVFEEQISPYKYKIEVSLDDLNWETVVDQSNNTDRAGGVLSDAISAQARYVRITILAAPSKNWGCFWEFTVWGNESVDAGSRG